MEKGHYGKYSGNARHSKHHMVNSWEEDDVRRGRKEMEEGHKGHAEALFDDAHGSYNWDGHNSTGAEHAPSRKSRSERLRNRAMKRSERSGAEWGDYDYEDPRVQKMLSKANKLDERSGEDRKTMHKKLAPVTKKGIGEMMQEKAQEQGQNWHGKTSDFVPAEMYQEQAQETGQHELLHKGVYDEYTQEQQKQGVPDSYDFGVGPVRHRLKKRN